MPTIEPGVAVPTSGATSTGEGKEPGPELNSGGESSAEVVSVAKDEQDPRQSSDVRSTFSGFSTGLSVDSHDTFIDLTTKAASLPSSVSASSSVFGVVEEHGRTYHKYKAGKYLLPNDEQEQNRLDLQHQIATRLLEGKLYLAPIGNVKKVLDIATGTGIWAVEFAEDHPEADVLGNDLSPIQPKFVSANLRFEIDDVEDEWVYSHKFDYIHGRYICPSLRDVPALLRKIYDNLEPGGYVEIMETLMIIEAIDDSLKDSHLPRWHQLMLDGVRRMGRDPMVPLKVKQWMVEAGFVGVTEKRFAVPANSWARGEEQKIRGALMMTNLLEAATGFTTLVCTKVWGWTPEQVEAFLVDVRADLQNRAHHGYVPILVIYGQRPAQ